MIDQLTTDYKTAVAEEIKGLEKQSTAAKEEYSRLVAGLDQLEGQIRDSIRRPTGYGLFGSFQTRQEQLVKSKKFWERALATVVTLSALLAVALIWDLSKQGKVDYGPAFFAKLAISLPLIYTIWFCSVQYSRERRLEEEYAFKSSISISLDPYRELVERLVTKEPAEQAKYAAFIIESVGRVFTSPMERAFDQSKESNPAEGIIKATGEVAKDILKLRKKW